MTQTFEDQVQATLVLRFKNGERIETTKNHPFYVESQGFTPASEMGVGTSVAIVHQYELDRYLSIL